MTADDLLSALADLVAERVAQRLGAATAARLYTSAALRCVVLALEQDRAGTIAEMRRVAEALAG